MVKTEVLSVRLDTETKEAFKQVASKCGKTPSEFLKYLINEEVKYSTPIEINGYKFKRIHDFD